MLASKVVTIDQQLLGNEEVVKTRSELVQRSGVWTLRSFVEFASGDQRLVLMPVDFESGFAADTSGYNFGVTSSDELCIGNAKAAYGVLGCGNDQLIRIQTHGTVLKYPVELPANATLGEANYFAQPGSDL